MSIDSDLNELLGISEGDGPASVAEPESVVTEHVATEPMAAESTEPAEGVTSEPVEEPVTAESAEPAATEPVTEDWQAERARLLAEIERLSGGEKPAQPTQSTQPAPAPVVEESSEPAKSPFELFSAEEVLDNPQKFMDFMKALHEYSKTQAVESAYLRMPEVMQKVSVQQRAMQEAATNFYKNNPELQSVKQYVARTATELSAANPDWGLAKVMEEAAKVCYTNLGIRKGLATSPAKAQAAPARTTKPGARSVGAPKLTGLAAEVHDLIKDMQ